MPIRFEWDPTKNDANQRKHGLRFEDAKPIFIWEAQRFDELDETYPGDEARFISVGAIPKGLITVVWTAPSDGVVRVISVRRANKRERRLYLAYNDIHQ